MDRRLEILRMLAGPAKQDKLDRVSVKISILELLREHGCLHLSDLKRCLKNEKNMTIAIGTLHKYTKQMIDVGILVGEKTNSGNRLFLSITDLSTVEWLFQGAESEKRDSDTFNNVLYYISVVKNRWDGVSLKFWGKRKMTLREYAPIIVSKLTASGLEPFKIIRVLNRVAQQIGVGVTENYEQVVNKGIEITSHDLEEVVERELEKIAPTSYEKFKELQKDFESLNQLKNLLEKYLPSSRYFEAPSLRKLKEVLEEMIK